MTEPVDAVAAVDDVRVVEIAPSDDADVVPVPESGLDVIGLPADGSVVQLVSGQENTAVLQVQDSAVRVASLPGGGSDTGGSVNPIVDWFTGVGPPPDALIGAGPGDMYVDVESGILYQLR